MRLTIFCFLLIIHGEAYLQTNLTTSNLPIVIINTNGQGILDEPKITADMGIIYNGPGKENKITDVQNEYKGKIGIELRGSTSQGFPKKPYGFETRDNTGNDLNVSLLGMPKESDWTLNATYNDKSLMRDGLAYMFAGSFMEYAPRVRYCELVLNDNYQGVYMLIEKIKRDKNRVDIAKMGTTDISGDPLTGGYIIKLDKTTGSGGGQGWTSSFAPYPGAWQTTYFQYEYPKSVDIVDQQKTYIRGYVEEMEKSLAGTDFRDPDKGFRKYIDTTALMDYIIINELTKNPDAYRLSTFFYKERDSDGGKIKFGPAWDYNLGFGNVDYCTKGDPEGLVLYNFNQVCLNDNWVVHFWWKRFLEDATFYSSLKQRWNTLRKNQLSDNRVNFMVDSISTMLNGAQTRNFNKWPVLGIYVWPNYYVGASYTQEVSWLSKWLKDRLAYLDRIWSIASGGSDPEKKNEIFAHPNPVKNTLFITLPELVPDNSDIFLTNIAGRPVQISTFTRVGRNIEMDLSQVVPGFYILFVRDGKEMIPFKIVKQ
ncbi:MAG: CotH kinase family protein [Saprospiraceae bacterium]